MAESNSTPAQQASTHGVDLYEAIGGRDTCLKLSVAFYARVKHDPLLRPLFPGKTFKCAIEEFAAFLAQFLGGPAEDAQRRWWLSLRESHLRFQIGQQEKIAWMKNMIEALNDVQIQEPMRSALRGFFDQSSSYVVNREPRVPVKESIDEPPKDEIHREIVRRWDLQRGLDQAVAAVRKRNGGLAVALAESPMLQDWFRRDGSVFAKLLGMMIASGERVMLDYVREKLLGNPLLAQARYSGRTLLHAAATAAQVTTVELLLSLDVDPNVTDNGGHTPLYCVGNESPAEGGGNVVRVLVQSGANVDAGDGVKHCTALHMAARRGNVDVAAALLDCGANIEARDSLGETPLRRSVNCGKTEVAKLLLSRGADVHSMGSKGLTPLLAARTEPMRRLLRTAAEK